MTELPPATFRSLNSAQRQQIFGTIVAEELTAGSGNIRIINNWQRENLTSVVVPQLIGVPGAPRDGRIFWHKKGIAALQSFFADVEKAGLSSLLLSWGGSWVPRYVRGTKTKTLSSHAHGIAFDINVRWNGLGVAPAPEGKLGSVVQLVKIAQAHGFFWGGHFARPDGMHFELTRTDAP